MDEIPELLPVTVISGFAGSGKSSLVRYLLAQAGSHRLGVIADQELGAPGGCLCCSLRDDLRQAVRRLKDAGSCNYLLIECGSVAEPLSVAELFTFEDEHGESLS